jgi:ubiquinone/menaquinone biosynthesis C-methylase UbiE
VTDSRDHYSYTVYADPAHASTFDQIRFGSPTGRVVSEHEAATFLRMAGPLTGRSVLDVGTGTGRIAFVLGGAGATVTGIDASDEMLKRARERAATEHVGVQFLHGDAHKLDFPNQSFDIVVSSRVLMHTPRWETCLSEWCRVARDRVVIDYPSSRSFALLQSWWRRGKHTLGMKTTQPYRVFLDRPVTGVFEQQGFRVKERHRHFVMPVGLYRLFGSPELMKSSEALFRQAGLSRLLASPVTVLAERVQRTS